MRPGLGAETKPFIRALPKGRGETVGAADKKTYVVPAVAKFGELAGKGFAGRCRASFIEYDQMARARVLQELRGFVCHARFGRLRPRGVNDEELELAKAELLGNWTCALEIKIAERLLGRGT